MPAKKKSSAKSAVKAQARAEKLAELKEAREYAETGNGRFKDGMERYDKVPQWERDVRLLTAEVRFMYKDSGREIPFKWMTADVDYFRSLSGSRRAAYLHALNQHCDRLMPSRLESIIDEVNETLQIPALFANVPAERVDTFRTSLKALMLMHACIVLYHRHGKDLDVLDALMYRLFPIFKAPSVYVVEQARFWHDMCSMSDNTFVDMKDTYSIERTPAYREMIKSLGDTSYGYVFVRDLPLRNVCELWKKSFMDLVMDQKSRTQDIWRFLMTIIVVNKDHSDRYIHFPSAYSPAGMCRHLYNASHLDCALCFRSVTERADEWYKSATRMYMRVVHGLPNVQVAVIVNDETGHRKIEVVDETTGGVVVGVSEIDVNMFARTLGDNPVKAVSDAEMLRDPGVFFRCPGTNHSVWRLCEDCYVDALASRKEEAKRCGFCQICTLKVSDFKLEYFSNALSGFRNVYSKPATDAMGADGATFALHESLRGLALGDEAGGARVALDPQPDP